MHHEKHLDEKIGQIKNEADRDGIFGPIINVVAENGSSAR